MYQLCFETRAADLKNYISSTFNKVLYKNLKSALSALQGIIIQ